jgi:hypothetical protein
LETKALKNATRCYTGWWFQTWLLFTIN